MVNPVDGSGGVEPRKISKSVGARPGEASEVSEGEESGQDKASVRRSGDLQKLVGKIRAADDIRKNRVHEVREMVQNDELLTQESIENAAERLLAEEF